MSDQKWRENALGTHRWSPWTNAGRPDPDHDDVDRVTRHALLTDANLVRRFRRRFTYRGDATYDEMVRRLEYVWDCPHDGTANVTGFCCASCGRRRSDALS
jgi:hypothetical protein